MYKVIEGDGVARDRVFLIQVMYSERPTYSTYKLRVLDWGTISLSFVERWIS